VLNAALRNTNSQFAREQVIAEAPRQGVDPGLVRLSTLQFAEAVKILPVFQREFKRLFAQFFNEGELGALESREQTIFRRVWSLWYFFSFHPTKMYADARRDCPKRLEKIMKEARGNVRRELRRLSSETFQAQMVSEEILWEEEKALWIRVDGQNALEVYQSVELVVEGICQAIRRVENTELRQYTLEFHWPFIVIVPLVRGKLLAAQGWRLFLSTFLGTDETLELQWFHLFPYPIPQDAWNQLSLATWEDSRLEVASQLLQSTSELSLLIAHICDFEEIPDDGQINQQLQNYVQSLSSRISATFESVWNLAEEIVNRLQNQDFELAAHHEQLLIVSESLQELITNLRPTSNFDGTVRMNLESTMEWRNRLEICQESAFRIYLSWVSFILNQLDTSLSSM